MLDPQASAYDDFDEHPDEVFRIFDEGEKQLTGRTGGGLSLAGELTDMRVTGNAITRERPLWIQSGDVHLIA